MFISQFYCCVWICLSKCWCVLFLHPCSVEKNNILSPIASTFVTATICLPWDCYMDFSSLVSVFVLSDTVFLNCWFLYILNSAGETVLVSGLKNISNRNNISIFRPCLFRLLFFFVNRDNNWAGEVEVEGVRRRVKTPITAMVRWCYSYQHIL